MKKFLMILFICSLSATVFAGDRNGDDSKGRYHNRIGEQLESILESEADTVISDMTFGEVGDLIGRLSVPLQEAAYIQKSKSASMFMPGMGQFMNGDALSGSLFMTADILIAAGTLVGVYFLLPAELQFGQLDYLNTAPIEIHDTWKAAAENTTFMEALPSLGVMAAGKLLHKGIGAWSARHAGKLAKKNIEEGSVSFEPRTSFFSGKHGKFGLGFGLKY